MEIDNLSIDFRLYESSDLEQILYLYRVCFGDHTTNTFIQKLLSGDTSVLDWKYKNSMRVVALDRDRIIGHSGTQQRKMIYGNKEINVAESVDLMVVPEFRRRGVATKLERYRENILLDQRVDMFLGFPNKLSEALMRTRSPEIPLYAIPLLEKTNLISKPWNDVYEIKEFGEDVNKLPNSIDCTTKREPAYLNWRFVENPLNSYDIFVQRTEQTQGYVILKKYNQTGHVVDFMADSHETLVNLLKFSEDYFSKKDMKAMSAYVISGSSYYDDFVKHGFVNKNIDRTFWVTPLNKKLEINKPA